MSTSPSSMATHATSELVRFSSNWMESNRMYVGAASKKSKMLWMKDMKVRLKRWNSQAGMAFLMISLYSL